MPRIEAFEAHTQRYEAWFDQHQAAYLSELLALRALVPWSGRGLEIGVGTARFAAPLGIQVGIDPSPKMLELAATRGIKCEASSVLDFLPGDSMPWEKRKRSKKSGLRKPIEQTLAIKQAFGFR